MQHPSLTKLYKPTAVGLYCIELEMQSLSPKLRPNIPSSSSSFHLTGSLDFIPRIFVCCFPRLFFPSVEENWFCIPTGKKKKSKKKPEKKFQGARTNRPWWTLPSCENSALFCSRPHTVNAGGGNTWMLETVHVNPILLYEGKGLRSNSEQAVFFSLRCPDADSHSFACSVCY